jgi:hypothetical protein
VSSKGLLREISHPLDYSATSVVFRERTSLDPDISVNGSKKDFFLVNPIPGYVSLFSILNGLVPTQVGCAISTSARGNSFLEALLSFTPSAEPDEETSWYLDELPYLGGEIFHIAGRGVLSADDFFLHGSCVFSICEFFEPGFFSHAGLKLRILPFTFEGLFGYCSDTYITPGHSFVKKMIDADTLVSIELSRLLLFKLGWGIEIDRSCLVPAPFLTSRQYYSFAVEAAIPQSKDIELFVSSKGIYDHKTDQNGGKEEKCNVDISASANIGDFDIETGFTFGVMNFEAEKAKTGIGLSLNISDHTLSLKTDLEIYPAIGFSSKLRYEYSFSDSRIFVSLDMDKSYYFESDSWTGFIEKPFDYISISLGFESTKRLKAEK